MNDSEHISPADPTPRISSSPGNQPQDTLLQRGAFDPPFNPGTLGRLNRFEIIRLLGEGGMGQVYLAREPLTDTRVALKIMKPRLADDPQEVHRFLTEARHMYRLSHPRILRVLEVSDRKEGPYYVMPYLAGGNLIAQCKPGEPMSTERILTIARQVAEALAHAHAHGLIHRDIKPGNVLLDKDGNAFLTDFGLVRTVFNDSMMDSDASHLEGTAPYMSPAVARGEAEDTRCDIYAFGAMLYELLAGQPPYTGRTNQMILDQILRGPPLPIRQVNPKASPALSRIAEGCMARELRDRYASMADVVADLARAANGAMLLGPHQQRHHFPRIAAVLIGTLAVAGLIGLAVHRWNAAPKRTNAGTASAQPASSTPAVANADAPAVRVPLDAALTAGGKPQAHKLEMFNDSSAFRGCPTGEYWIDKDTITIHVERWEIRCNSRGESSLLDSLQFALAASGRFSGSANFVFGTAVVINKRIFKDQVIALTNMTFTIPAVDVTGLSGNWLVAVYNSYPSGQAYAHCRTYFGTTNVTSFQADRPRQYP